MPLKIANVSKRYDDQWILRDFTLEIADGEIFGLLGANGSGKSVVLRLLAGSEKPNSGQISFHETDVSDAAAAAAAAAADKTPRLTLVPTGDANQISWKNIFLSTKTEQISEGERQNSDFLNALEKAEKFLLLDNPFACLDRRSRDRALEILRQKAKERKLTVILATNDFEDAFLVCDRVGVLSGGAIAQTGTPRDLYQHPNSTAVAEMLGRCNLIAARRVTFNNQPFTEFQTLAGEHRIRADRVEKSALGAITDNVSLMIRPEHISISFGASFPEDNLLKAKIESVQYCGPTTRVRLDADGLILEALVLRLVGLNEGDECLVGLPPDRILVLRD
jgi:ABC-type Fe3+/spermidine/putrescine transport system ATPase subunit